MPSKHAILAPSAAKRWMACPPSARAEQGAPDRETDYAKEGTLAHEVAELSLRQLLKENVAAVDGDTFKNLSDEYWADMEKISGQCEALGTDWDDMFRTVRDYYVIPVYEDYLRMKMRDAEALLLVEAELNLSSFIPEGFGSSDAVIIGDETLHVYDLKYGKGVMVEAEHNPQMMCYALGALYGPADTYCIRTVYMTILQPRLQHESTASLPYEELVIWGKHYLRPAAEKAFMGEGEYRPGDHCQFCKVAPRCRACALRAKVVSEAYSQPDLLSDEELADAVAMSSSIKNWAAKVEEHALAQMLSGKQLKGLKVVEGRSLRKISDQEAALDALIDAGFACEDVLKPHELKTISDLEKMLGKKGFGTILGKFVVKPQGKPTIAPESDKRPPFSPSAAEDFNNS